MLIMLIGASPNILNNFLQGLMLLDCYVYFLLIHASKFKIEYIQKKKKRKEKHLK